MNLCNAWKNPLLYHEGCYNSTRRYNSGRLPLVLLCPFVERFIHQPQSLCAYSYTCREVTWSLAACLEIHVYVV